MAYDKDQNESALPVNGTGDTSASNFLPKYFRTDTNKKFINSTIDQMIKPGVVEKINSFAGRRYAKAASASDSYLADVSATRENYQFEPAMVYKDELDNVEFFKDYTDFLGQLSNFKGNTSNHSVLNSQEFYAWNPHIDWDKFTNFREYYWLPMGPTPIAIAGQTKDIVSTYTVGLEWDGDNYAFVFSPNGFTRNPRLKLYRGQTYRFEISAVGHPMAFALSRVFSDQDTTPAYDPLNVSTLYKNGIKKYEYDAEGKLVETTNDYIENGVIEFTVSETSPNTLYYISQNDINVSGIASTYEITEATEFNVEEELLGKKTYKTDAGIDISNGMKLTFQGTVTPAEYRTGYWYVEGVGSAIKLVAEANLEVPAIFTSSFNIPFDNYGFDNYPFEDATSYPGTVDYIVINRSSADRNPWSRYNRWFHKDVVEASALANGQPVEFDQNARAKRPIIEFEAGLKLYEHGAKSKHNVQLVDTFTTDVFSTIEGSIGYNVDGVDLVDRMRVLFTADTDILVKGKIYQVKFITHNSRRQITLIETDDSVPEINDTVLVLKGNKYAGNMFYFNGTEWAASQDKTSVNQFPLFDLFDKNGYSYSDSVYYPTSNFSGNMLFNYKVGTGTNDAELGFPLSYRNISNVGDIVFDFSLLSEGIRYQDNNNDVLVSTDIAFLKKYNSAGNDFIYENGWKKANAKSKQSVIRNRIIVTQFNNFPIDVYDNSAGLTDLIVNVWVNGARKYETTDYVISRNNGVAFVVFNSQLSVDNILLIKTHSSASKNANGLYEIPINFEKNPLNDNITAVTLGEINDHVDSISDNHPEFNGVFPGTGNLRDIGNLTAYGRRFVQHSGPFNLALYNLTDKNANLIKSLKFARKEYAKFKRQFIYEANQTGFHGSAKDHVDLVLKKIAESKTAYRPFYFSDMAGVGASTKTVHSVEYNGPAYFALSRSFDLETLSIKAVSVYLNGIQLMHNKDYIFSDSFVYVSLDLVDSDIVEVYEYESTSGSYIPPTPTKLGLYPKFQPMIISDNTYLETVNMIQGHDGSLVKTFGDYRDDLILELEMRIFNNIKCNYNTDSLNIFDFVPGINRETGITKSSIDTILLADFAQWLELAGSPDYSSNISWSELNGFTFNYSEMGDLAGNALSGYWRSVYKTYFDTDRPHTHPWEMIGFTIKPTWFENVYGPAPYTKDNTILWTDLSEGIIREPGQPLIRDTKFIRLSLLNNIPVDEYGRLQNPLDCGLAQYFSLVPTKDNFAFGNEAPVETAWRRSSEYPFSLITAWAILQPAQLLGLGFDCSRIKRDIVGNLIYTPTNKRIRLEDLVFPSISTTQPLVLTSGLVNYIANYMVNKVTTKYETYKTQLANSKNQLAVKLGGFADKTKLKLVLDSRSPLNKSSVFVPDENYQIFFNVSSPLATPVFSGIMIEKSSAGYIVTGYDKEDPVFNYNAPIIRQTDSAITVGGISESYVNWDTNTQYVSGTVIFNSGKYYRTVSTHVSGISFDATKFSALPSLPITGGVTSLLRNEFFNEVSSLPYGTVLTSIQEITDFMLGYENYLVNQGFEFSFYNKNTEALEDMKLCLKEFMFWVTQNWDIGTVLTISPAANQLKFTRDYYIVDDIYDGFYDVSVLSGSGTRLKSEFSNIFRSDQNEFGIKPQNTEDGIYLAKLPLVQKEHVILIDNQTVFNDTIYDVAPGYRQDRIKLVGYRTDNWTGGLHIPGFFYDDAKVSQWAIWTDYAIGAVVKQNEFYYAANTKHSSTDVFDSSNWNILAEKPQPALYPNWDYKVNQFTDFYDLDTDNFDTEQQRLGQHLIGYQPREYLKNIITDSVSQYKFYQGFIQDKGTTNSLTKLFDALSSADKDSLEFYEEWAFRLGQYGAVENTYEVEYQLDENKFKIEPQLFELNNSISSSRTDLVYEIAPHQALLKPTDYTHSIFIEKSDTEVIGFDSGYVRNNDVDYVAIVKEQLTFLPINDVNIGNFIWVQKENQDWTVYRNVATDNPVIDIVPALPEDRGITLEAGETNTGFTIYFEHNVTDFVDEDIIGIRSGVASINGFFKIKDVFLNQVVVLTRLAVSNEEYTDSSVAGISKFVERRFANATDLNSNIKNIVNNIDDKVWIDDTGNGTFGVFTNKSVFSIQEELLNPTGNDDNFASSFDVNKSNTVMVVNAVGNESVYVFKRNSESFTKTLSQTFIPDNTIDVNSEFGFDVAISADARYIAVGAPTASNVKTKLVGTLSPAGNYNTGDVVSDRGTLWRAKVDVAGDNSTITNLTQDWEPVYLLEATDAGTASGLATQGVVYLYKLNLTTNTYNLEHVVVSPIPAAKEKFGYKIELRQTSYGTTKLFVGAPGENNVDQGRIYFFETDNSGAWTHSKDRNYKGEWSLSGSYNENEIVFLDGVLYQATTNGVTENPNSSTKWKLADVAEYTGHIPHNLYLDTDTDNNTVYNLSTNIGVKFDVNETGDVIALSASADYGLLAQDVTIKTERVSIFENQIGRWTFLQYVDAEDSVDGFGYVVALNESGNALAISAPVNDDRGIDQGVVYIYQRTTTNNVSVYNLSQTLQSPFAEENEMFGTGISFSSNKLAISGKNTDARITTTFDRYSQIEFTMVARDTLGNPVYSRYVLDETSTETTLKTTFDGNNTSFITVEKDTGRIAVFQEIGNAFVYGEDLEYNRNTKYNDISNFKINNNHLYIGFPELNPATASTTVLQPGYLSTEDSSLGMLVDMRSEINVDSWEELSAESGKIDLNKISKVFLYSKTTNDIIANIDLIDPRQGKIPGIAEQEISFKTFYDPAVYSANQTGLSGVTVDNSANWTENYVGKLWWSIVSATWMNPYQGDVQYRAATWNRLADSGSIEVYEWVKTTLTPTQWRAQADTSEGFAKGISGTPKYDDSVFSADISVDAISGRPTTNYFYWVRNNRIIPRGIRRRISCYDVEQIIRNPAATGYRYIAPLDTNKFALYNIQSLIEGTDTVLHISFKRDEKLQTNVHSEYQLLTEGLDVSIPNAEIEQKWVDSLVGYDLANNPVPDTGLSPKQKYGILNSPRQGMFVNRLEAVKQFVERVNIVLLANQTVDNYVLDQMLLVDEAPLMITGKFDKAVDLVSDLDFVGVAKVEQAMLTPVIENGKIISVTITKPGRGYKVAPKIDVNTNTGTGAILTSIINNLGQITSVTVKNQGKKYDPSTNLQVRKFSVLVNADTTIGGRWAIYSWSVAAQVWERNDIQSFNTTNYWEYADWYATDYSGLTAIDQVIDQSYQLFGISDSIGDIVKINTIGSGGWLLLEKIDSQLTEDYTVNYKTIGRENGTIQLLTRLYDYATVTSGYDAMIYDNAFYDREPIAELRNIHAALKNNIFVGDLAVEYNNLFFASIRYAFSEQSNIDWAFKTSFIRAKHNLGGLSQKVTFQNDNLENYEEYVNEVKPYSSKIREYISSYNQVESTVSLTTDFDVPPSYNITTKEIETIEAKFNNNTISNIVDKYMAYPYKSWVDNNGYDVVEIVIANGGSGYKETPVVTVSGNNGTTAQAYLSRGRVSSIKITNTGGKYYKAPVITIDGTLEEGATPARAVAILGNGVVRKAHLTIKFDRVKGTYLLTDLNVTETFTGTGANQVFNLKWPMSIRTDSFSLYVDNKLQLSSEYTVSNTLDTSKGYDRYLGKVEFTNAPATGSVVTINYKKDASVLDAADRIYSFYNPTAGMPGKDLSQLMDGVEYSGAIYNSIDFGTIQGWDPDPRFDQGFGSTPWDTFDNTYQDEIFVLDESTTVFELAAPLEAGVAYNVYLNNVRLDDTGYNGSSAVTNPNAVMQTIIGDGVTTVVIFNEENISTSANDVVIIRKSTSDGSFTPTENSYDTALGGGNLTYTTATGLLSADITVDGDGFVTPTTSAGPEELVPGQLVDTLDIRVYHRPSNGVGIIGVASYKLGNDTTEFALPKIPHTGDSAIIKIDGEILDSSLYTINWKAGTLTIDDSSLGDNLSIVTIGTNGIDIIDTDSSIFDGSTLTYETAAIYSEEISALVTINGRVLTAGAEYDLVEGSDRRAEILLTTSAIEEGNLIQYTVYDSLLQTYSRIQIDNTFESNGENKYHKFDAEGPIPFTEQPFSHNVLVKSNNRILSPGYSISYTATTERDYDIEAWQFADISYIPAAEVLVYVDGVQLTTAQVTYDPVNARIRILRNDIATIGSKIEIYVINGADYFFVDTQIDFESVDSSVLNIESYATVGSEIRMVSATDGNVYTSIVKAVKGNSVVIETYRPDIRDAFVLDPEFMVDISDGDSSLLLVTDVLYIESDSLTFAVPPSSGENIEIYTFSNHDVNNFSRMTYDVVSKTVVAAGADDYVKRNLLTRGILKLREAVYGTPYVWVAVNGELLTPYVDYTVVDSLDAVQLKVVPQENDRIDVLQFGAAPVTPKFGYRIFKDMLNRTHYKRLNQDNSYTLASPLNYYDARILLDDATGIFQPSRSKNIPGVLFIEGERIEYFEIRGNALLQLRRGTLGTGVRTVYAEGMYLYGQGPEETITYQDRVLRQTMTADGISVAYSLDFIPGSINEIDVFLGGTRLRNTSIEVYQPNIAQDSNEGNITISAEFRVVGSTLYIEPRDTTTGEIITPALWEDQRIEVVRKIGQVWNEPGKTLAESNNAISNFLRKATIRLPK